MSDATRTRRRPDFVGRAVNAKTGETRIVSASLERARRWTLFDGVAPCSGECGCEIEPDGTCENGWPAMPRVLGIV